MQYFDTNTGRTTRFSSRVAHSLRFVLSAKRFGYTAAGVCAFAGAAAAINAGVSSGDSDNHSLVVRTTQASNNSPEPTSAGAPLQSTASSNSAGTNLRTSVSSNSSAKPSVQVNVNGTDIPIATNGDTHQTVTSADGNTTTVISSSSSSTGDSNTDSSMVFNLNVNSSTTTGGDPTQ